MKSKLSKIYIVAAAAFIVGLVWVGALSNLDKKDVRDAALEGAVNPPENQENMAVETGLDDQGAENKNEFDDPELLLPDLLVEPLERDVRIEIGGGNEQKNLRFPGVIDNLGDGPLEMAGEVDETTNTTRATQRIYKKDGSREERLIGNFVLHREHSHWHFEDFIEFGLYTLGADGAPDKKLVSTGKLTFCVYDTAPITSAVEGAATNSSYPRCKTAFATQGISRGWYDEYTADVPGQSLDVRDLPDGRYVFRAVVDPDNRILEKNESNNETISYIEIEENTARIIERP